MKLHSKLSTKTVCGDLAKVAAQYEEGEEVIVMTIWGHAVNKEAGVNVMSNGDESAYVKFFGKVAAYPGPYGEGEVCRAGIAVMPAIPTALLDAQVRSYKELVDKKGQFKWDEKDARKFIAEQDVQYGFQIGITIDSSSGRGYKFFAAPLMEPENKDALDELGDTLAENSRLMLETASKRQRLPAPGAAVTKKTSKRKTKRKARA